MRKAKSARVLTLACSLLLCAVFIASVYRTGEIGFINASVMLLGLLIAYLEIKKSTAGKVMAGIVLALSAIFLPLGYLSPMDGNNLELSTLHLAEVFIVATILLLAATVCLRR